MRQAARAASLSRPSPPTETALGRNAGTSSTSGLSNDDKSFQHSLHNVCFEDNGNTITVEKVDWQELLGSSEGRGELDTGDGSQPDFYDESSPTPRAAPMTSDPILSQGPVQPATLQVQSLPASPSLATASSPASSALGHSPSSTRQEVRCMQNFKET